jgi:hypothetical protein
MSVFFSPATGSFYVPGIHGARKILVPADDGTAESVEIDNPDTLIPADAVEISVQRHADLLEGYAEGKIIAAGDSGLPILSDPVGPSHEEKMTRLRGERDRRILVADNRVSRYVREVRMGIDPTDDIAALDAYIQALADLPEVVVTQGLDPLDPPWPEVPA